MNSDLEKVKIRRDVNVPIYRFVDYFKGFENVEAVRQIFGDETEKVLNDLKIEFFHFRRGYMGVNDQNGHLFINANYIKTGDKRDIYLDIIHELVHVKQYIEGKPLFAGRVNYVDRPTEIEAYRHTIKEARRIGMTEEEIYEYLKVDWISNEDAKKLAITLGIKIEIS